MTSQQEQKQAAAEYAAALVSNGMIVGLGSGTTAELVIRQLGRHHAAGLRLLGIPTSDRVRVLASHEGIPLGSLDAYPHLDMTIDGADEVDPAGNLIKGHGGALLHEKLVALASARYVIVVDESKVVSKLGVNMPVPIEVVRFGWVTTQHRLEELGLECVRREDREPFVTDSGNYILDCRLPPRVDLADSSTAQSIKLQPGVVAHGLFLRMRPEVVVGRPVGAVDVIGK